MTTWRAGGPLLRAASRPLASLRCGSARALGGYVRPRSPLAQAAWDYQEEAKARLEEDGGITTETAFEILAVRPDAAPVPPASKPIWPEQLPHPATRGQRSQRP